MERIIKNKTKTCASQVQGTKRSLKFVYPGHGSFPLCEKFRKFKRKWKIPFRFLLTGIIVITSGGVPLISVRINILTETRCSIFDKSVPIGWPVLIGKSRSILFSLICARSVYSILFVCSVCGLTRVAWKQVTFALYDGILQFSRWRPAWTHSFGIASMNSKYNYSL